MSAPKAVDSTLDTSNSIALRMKKIEDAKQAYDVYAHRMGRREPWEALSNNEQAAWKETVAFIGDRIYDESAEFPECEECHGDLVCPKCDDILCAECESALDLTLCADCAVALSAETEAGE